MKVGIRHRSFKKSLSAMTKGRLNRSIKRKIIPFYGKKGTGIIKNPKKAIYNKIYRKTTIASPLPYISPSSMKKTSHYNNKGITMKESNKQETNFFKKHKKVIILIIAIWIVFSLFCMAFGIGKNKPTDDNSANDGYSEIQENTNTEPATNSSNEIESTDTTSPEPSPQSETEPSEKGSQEKSNSSPNSGVTTVVEGYCNDGSYVKGDPSRKGKGSACYGHGGWRDY